MSGLYFAFVSNLDYLLVGRIEHRIWIQNSMFFKRQQIYIYSMKLSMSLPINLDIWPYSSVDEEGETRMINSRVRLGFFGCRQNYKVAWISICNNYLNHFNNLAIVLTALGK